MRSPSMHAYRGGSKRPTEVRSSVLEEAVRAEAAQVVLADCGVVEAQPALRASAERHVSLLAHKLVEQRLCIHRPWRREVVNKYFHHEGEGNN